MATMYGAMKGRICMLSFPLHFHQISDSTLITQKGSSTYTQVSLTVASKLQTQLSMFMNKTNDDHDDW